MALRSVQFLRAVRARDDGYREAAECRVFGVRPGCIPSDKPAVRIFVGTEARQFRAERALLWSIAQHRDPTRVYEIHLMHDLAGFTRRRWLTGFTNFRFVVPHLAGGRGRAIYNDVDQLYLADPAALFDTDMGEHGYLAVSPYDTSVMLLDCARMAEIWPLHRIKRDSRRALDRVARGVPGLWGALAPGWNARDNEYRADESRLIHYTTIHAQPWRPFPRDYVYLPHAQAALWEQYERSADAAGFEVFDAREPSSEFAASMATPVPPLEPGVVTGLLEHVQAMVAEHPFAHMACLGGTKADDVARVFGAATMRIEHRQWSSVVAWRGTDTTDILVCARTLESVPDGDLGWVLDRLFAQRPRVLALLFDLRRPVRPGAHRRDVQWWLARITHVARRHPAVHWHLAAVSTRQRYHFHSGGAPLGNPPRVLVIGHYKAGHDHQARDLAAALGWPSTERKLDHLRVRHGIALELRRVFGLLPPRFALPERPYPDLVISSGWLPGLVARAIGQASGGRCRQVRMGRKAGAVEETEDIVVSCRHFGLPAHPRRILTLVPAHGALPLAAPRPASPSRARPHVLLLVGGASRECTFTVRDARALSTRVAALCRREGADLSVVTSPRTGARNEAALRQALPAEAAVYSWQDGVRREHYLALLARADAVIVTGDSESMLAEIASTRVRFYIYPLPPARWRLGAKLSALIDGYASGAVLNPRGTPRPQSGLRYLCARAVERGLIVPPRRLDWLHETLVRAELAEYLGDALNFTRREGHDESRRVASMIKTVLGWPMPAVGARQSETLQEATEHSALAKRSRRG